MTQTYFPHAYFPAEYFPKEYWPVIVFVYSTDPRRIFVVPAESRNTLVETEQRQCVLPAENRTTLVEAES